MSKNGHPLPSTPDWNLDSSQRLVKVKATLKMSCTLASCVTFPYPKGKKMGCQWRPFASWVKNLNMKHLKCKIFYFQACCPNTLGDFRETPISLKEVKWSVTTLLAPGVMCQVPINPFESVYNQKHRSMELLNAYQSRDKKGKQSSIFFDSFFLVGPPLSTTLWAFIILIELANMTVSGSRKSEK